MTAERAVVQRAEVGAGEHDAPAEHAELGGDGLGGACGSPVIIARCTPAPWSSSDRVAAVGRTGDGDEPVDGQKSRKVRDLVHPARRADRGAGHHEDPKPAPPRGRTFSLRMRCCSTSSAVRRRRGPGVAQRQDRLARPDRHDVAPAPPVPATACRARRDSKGSCAVDELGVGNPGSRRASTTAVGGVAERAAVAVDPAGCPTAARRTDRPRSGRVERHRCRNATVEAVGDDRD